MQGHVTARPLASTGRTSGIGAVRRRASMAATLAACVAWVGCAFEGYVPKGPPPKPLEAPEANIADLPIGSSVTGNLDCPQGLCRVRYRIITPSSGELVVSIDGPVGQGDQRDQGPRIARTVLEGVGQQTLAVHGREDGPPPYAVRSAVQRGVHYVLIQGLGGAFDYTVSATFTPEAGAVTEPDTELAMPDPAPVKQRRSRSVERTVVPLPRHAPGDLSDGADYASDPDFDANAMRTYAFAQDPAAMLKSKPGTNVGDPFMLRQIQREIRYVLADAGRQQVPANEADFLVAVGVGSKSTTWWSLSVPGFTDSYDYYFNQWDRTGVGIQSHTYQDGTLMIDFLDPTDGKLLWHGWTVEDVPISGDENKLLKKAVANVLGQI